MRDAAVAAAIGPGADHAVDIGGEERRAQRHAVAVDAAVLEGLAAIGETLAALRDAPRGDQILLGMIDPAVERVLIGGVGDRLRRRAGAFARAMATATTGEREQRGGDERSRQGRASE